MRLDGKRAAAVNWLNERVYSGAYKIVPVATCFCGSTRFEELSRFDRFGLPFGTQICIDCGLISQTRRLEESDMESFYNDIYWPLVSGNRESTFTTAQASFEPFLGMLLPHVPSSVRTVFEVGCGAGERLARAGQALSPRPILVGCDYSERALDLAKRRGIDARLGGFETFKGPVKADVLILSHIVEHLVDLTRALADIRNITHDASAIYVEVPGVIDLVNKREYGYDYQDYNVIAHIHNFSLGTLAGVFATAGFGLVAGNEYVRAVFRRSELTLSRPARSAYDEIRAALAAAERKASRERGRVLPRLKSAIRAASSELRK